MSLTIMTNGSILSDRDRLRAIAAAEECLDRHGISAESAWAGMQEALETGIDSAAELAWREADSAASIAATEGWVDPAVDDISLVFEGA